MIPRLVWYVAYGSNLAWERFRVYLEGGTPAGGARAYAGCRDPAPPRGDVALAIPHRLYFAGRSRTWGGGVAFVDPAPGPDVGTLARAWLMTAGQLEDVVAQERDAPHAAIDAEAVVREGVVPLGDGAHYGTILGLGALRGLPALTCTAPPPGPGGLVPSAPTAAYLQLVARGLAEAHGLALAAAARYLAPVPGVAGRWRSDDLAAVLGAAP